MTHPALTPVLERYVSRPVRVRPCLGAALSAALLAAAPAFAAAPGAPTNLKVNDVANPVGTEAAPYFGWHVNDPDANETQTKYQIVVSTGPDGTGTVWDSGAVTSRAQNHVAYAGPALAADGKYYWRVRTWDKEDAAGPYSAPATFTVGPLANADWAGAQWIRRDNTDPDDYTYFRKTVDLPNKPVARAAVYVTSVHKYELFLNGQLVGKGPAYQYPQFQYYNGYDITSLVKPGANLFAVFNHWFGGGQGRATSARGVLLKAVIHYTDGTAVTVGTDGTWKQIRAPGWVLGQGQRNGGEGVGYIERIDGRALIPDWNQPGFDDAAWAAATVLGPPPTAPWTFLLAPDLTRIVEREITPVAVTQPAAGVYVVDFGKVYAGVPLIKFSGGTAGTVVNMMGGYMLNDSGVVNTQRNQGTNLGFFAVLSGGNFTYLPAEYIGMRYLQITNPPMPITPENTKFIARHSQAEEGRTSFASPNVTLNAVWELMKHSLLVCAQEEYVDTPTREKGGFLGDGAIQSIAALPVTYERTLTQRQLREFLASMDQFWSSPQNLGRMNAVYPNNDNGRDIPDYTQAYLVWAWEYFQETGDKAFLVKYYDYLKAIADYVYRARNPATGLITNLPGGGGQYVEGIIDWPASMRYGYDMSAAARTVINGWAYADFDFMSKIAGVVGNTADRDLYRTRAEELKAAINQRLFNADGVYIDGLLSNGGQSQHVSQHANIFPLAFDYAPADKRAGLVELVKSQQMRVGMITVMQLVQALGESDQGPHLIELFTNPEWPGWARTLALGGTCTWETWNSNTDGNSMSHGWGAAGLVGYTRYILGVKPLRPQYEEVQIKPLDFGAALPAAAGVVATDRGDIAVSWERAAARYVLNVNLPANVGGVVYVPKGGSDNPTVKVDGVNVQGVVEGNYVRVPGVGSGAHVIERAFNLGAAKTQWSQSHFSVAERANPAVSGDAADPDADRLDNFLEYAFDFNPRANSLAFLPRPELLAGGRTLRFTVPALRDEVNYAVETSTDLLTWNPVAVASGGATAPHHFTTDLALAPGEPRFVRVVVSAFGL